MPTARDLRDSFDRVARQMDSDVPHHLQQTLRVGRRRVLIRRTVSVVAVAAAIALSVVLVGTSFIRSSPTPANHPPTPIAPLMHNGPLTYATNFSGVFEIDPLTGSAKRIVIGPVTSFDWSPDGSAIAYVVEARIRCEIWVQNTVSGGSRRLTGCGSGVLPGGQQLDWSPDGSRIAFVHSDESIHVIKANGSGERPLTTPSTAAGVSWSPDGTRMVYEKDRSFWVMGSDGSSPRLIASGWWPTWSPDGRTVAFLRDVMGPSGSGYPDPGVLQIWTVRPDGSQPELVASSPGCCLGAKPTLGWSPDGSMLVLTGVRFETFQADGSGSKVLRIHANLTVRPSWRPVP